jgi:diguanylate cyclase
MHYRSYFLIGIHTFIQLILSKGEKMRYTWRIIFTAVLLISNAISISRLDEFSTMIITAYIVNVIIGWIIGYQIDKYRFSKKELGSTRTALIDYSHALDSAPDGIGITKENGQFEFLNEAHLKLYGYSKEEMLEKSWQDCYSKETIDQLQKTALPQLLKHGKWRGETIGIRKDGSTFPQEIALSVIDDTKKVICVVRDLTEQKQYVDYIKHIAEHNDLTKLPNRRRLLNDIQKSMEELPNTSLLFIDLDRFKMVNDTLGHDIGDELLVSVAKRLLSFQNEFIQVYHQGGDEFIILIQNSAIDYVKNVAVDVINNIKEPYYINGNEVIITTSVGVSRYPDHTDNFKDLIKMADTAMYHAKLDGKNTFKFFTNNLRLQLERKAKIEAELRRAINNDEFSIHYQPKFNLVNLTLVGMEALIRWENPNLGRVSPAEFIPIAEDTGLINDIGNWVIKEVLNQMSEWQARGYSLVKMSVNVSQRQFRDQSLVNYVESCLSASKINAKYFEIEITETVLEDFDLVIPQLTSLREIGIGISIDDFGTGYSSLNFIKNLPADTLKVDQSFVQDMLSNTNNSLLVKTIIEIGNTLNFTVVAEGIETEKHLHKLIELNCPVGQGYYFSKPLDAAEIESRFLK